MVAQKGGLSQEEKDRMIRDIHRAYPYWSNQAIADLVGDTRQRVWYVLHKCEKNDIISNMDNKILDIGNKPISATEAASKAQIPYYIIADWVRRKLVKVVSRPETPKACTNHCVLLDPVTLQERIRQYKPRKKANPA